MPTTSRTRTFARAMALNCTVIGLLLCSCTNPMDADRLPAEQGAFTGGTDSGGTATGSGGAGGTASGGAISGGAASGGTEASSGGAQGDGGSPVGSGGMVGATGGSPNSGPTEIRAMSLNVYGYATMPQAAPQYASLIEGLNIDVLGIQEGVDDWQIQGLPTDYSRADALGAALGDCWEQGYQVFVNTCRGVSLIQHERFDMTDGPNAVRTGEKAIVQKDGKMFAFIDVHWDHESQSARSANANETADAANDGELEALIVLGDFNSGCGAGAASSMSTQSNLSLIVNGGIDCIFTRSMAGMGHTLDASPSDHPGAVATLTL